MFRVENPVQLPGQCAVTGRHRDDDGFIDTGLQLGGYNPHVYISFVAARELGRFVGMIDPAEYERVVGEVERLERELATAQEQLDEAERFADSVDYTFKGLERIRQKPGPKTTREKATA